MTTWKNYIEEMRKEWIGRIVKFDGIEYTVVDVDYNGSLMIDKKARFTDTTAVLPTMIDVIK